MGKESLYTLHGHNMFEISSLIQKALRRQDCEMSYYAASEMKTSYRGYLWKRLLVTSAEDCYDMVTRIVLEDRLKDKEEERDEYIEHALSKLLLARKSRDSDYFACNLFNSKFKKEIPAVSPIVQGYEDCITKNGHYYEDVAVSFKEYVVKADFQMAGYCACEMLRYRKYLWRLVNDLAHITFVEEIIAEVHALEHVYWASKDDGSNIIFMAKAITILLKFYSGRYKDQSELPTMVCTLKLKDFAASRKNVPYYTYDCHTFIGKKRGKTKRDFVKEEQAGLKPLHAGEFDNASWEPYFDMSNTGFYVPETETPWPPKKKIDDIGKGTLQLSLF